jgi:ABC-type multidrug transport system permease subunit
MNKFRKVFFEVRKNTKLIIRNWSSLLVIIFSPLILLALVGYALSGSDVHDIYVGVIADDPLVSLEMELLMEDTASIIKYDSVDNCIIDMRSEKNSLCAVIKGNFITKTKEIPGGEVTFYYDNTRPKVTLLLLTEFKKQLGLTSEQISITSAEVIMNDINDFIGFLNARIDDIGDIEEQTTKIQNDLEERLVMLEDINKSFTPNYLFIKNIEKEVVSHENDIEKARGVFNSSMDQLRKTKFELEAKLAETEMSMNQSFNSLLINVLLRETIEQAQKVVESAETSAEEIKKVSLKLTLLVRQLDVIHAALQGEIARTKDYIIIIEQGKDEIQVTLTDARSKMDSLVNNDPQLVERLIKPIVQFFKPLVPEIKGFHVAFPLLLSTVIVFMSMIVGNIITLLELNNKARIRNLLAPTSNLIFVGGIIITSLIIVAFQSVVLLALGQLTFGLSLLPVIFNIVIILFMLSVLFICLGMIIANVAPTIESSLLFSTILSLLFFLFSDALQAIQLMPSIGYVFAKYNPLVISEILLRKVIFLQSSVFDFLGQFIILFLYALVSLIIISILSVWRSRVK